MKLAGRNHALQRRSITEAIRYFQQCGFDGMELGVLRGFTNVVALDYLEDFCIKHVRDVCAEKPEFRITALSCHANYTTDDFIFGVQKRLLRTARKYGTDIVIMSTSVPLDVRESNEKELYAQLEKRTAELCEVAEGEGVQIAIEVEPNQMFRNLSIFLEMASRIQSKALKLNFDIGHIYLSEVDIAAAAQRAKEYIVHAHIDNMCMGEHCHKLPWEGEIDLAAACKALRKAGFDGDMALTFICRIMRPYRRAVCGISTRRSLASSELNGWEKLRSEKDNNC